MHRQNSASGKVKGRLAECFFNPRRRGFLFLPICNDYLLQRLDVVLQVDAFFARKRRSKSLFTRNTTGVLNAQVIGL